nr:hypothetical protein CFP56_64907 [Quercus suber]
MDGQTSRSKKHEIDHVWREIAIAGSHEVGILWSEKQTGHNILTGVASTAHQVYLPRQRHTHGDATLGAAPGPEVSKAPVYYSFATSWISCTDAHRRAIAARILTRILRWIQAELQWIQSMRPPLLGVGERPDTPSGRSGRIPRFHMCWRWRASRPTDHHSNMERLDVCHVQHSGTVGR